MSSLSAVQQPLAKTKGFFVEQLLLNFPKKQCFNVEDFMPLACHKQVLAHLHDIVSAGQGMAYIYGAEGVGKSHLLHVIAHALGCSVSTPKTVPLEGKAVLVDDIDQTQDQGAEKLFHTFNRIEQEGGIFIVASNKRVNALNLLPDLKSRLHLMPFLELSDPSEKELEVLAVKMASDRQMTITPEVLSFILKRAERSPRQVEGIIEALDKTSLTEQKKITIPFIKQTLGL